MAKKSFPLSKVYTLLEPGPVVLLTTSRKGKPNVMTMSWLTMMEFEPPLIGCIVSDLNYSFKNLSGTKECVINIPTADILDKVVACGNSTGAKTDKFAKFNITTKPAAKVKAPLIEECFANLECRVVDTRMVNKYSLFVLEAVQAWIDPKIKNPRTVHHRGKGSFMIAGKTIKTKSRMK